MSILIVGFIVLIVIASIVWQVGMAVMAWKIARKLSK